MGILSAENPVELWILHRTQPPSWVIGCHGHAIGIAVAVEEALVSLCSGISMSQSGDVRDTTILSR